MSAVDPTKSNASLPVTVAQAVAAKGGKGGKEKASGADSDSEAQILQEEQLEAQQEQQWIDDALRAQEIQQSSAQSDSAKSVTPTSRQRQIQNRINKI